MCGRSCHSPLSREAEWARETVDAFQLIPFPNRCHRPGAGRSIGPAPSQAQQLLPPTTAEFGQWEALAPQARSLSPDGGWLAYGITRSNRENELRIVNVGHAADRQRGASATSRRSRPTRGGLLTASPSPRPRKPTCGRRRSRCTVRSGFATFAPAPLSSCLALRAVLIQPQRHVRRLQAIRRRDAGWPGGQPSR